MKAILISDHAKWCALMMNGIKKIEVRKGTALYKATQKLIDEYGYAEFYVYCTKEDDLLTFDVDMFIYGKQLNGNDIPKLNKDYNGKGKVVFKFRCYKVEEITIVADDYWTETYMWLEDLLKDSCLSYTELDNYLKYNRGCAIHISDLEIFDKPKELSEFKHYNKPNCNGCPFQYSAWCDYHIEVECDDIPLTKAPQSWCYIESEV